MGRGQPNSRDIGRWAHINVKLLHLRYNSILPKVACSLDEKKLDVPCKSEAAPT